MIVYNDTKRNFVDTVRQNQIADVILQNIREKGLNAGQDREYNSWQNSMQFMCNIVDSKDIADDVSIAIEYNIPMTSKRVDFMIYGSDATGTDNVVIIELKQWSKAEIVDDQMHYSVRSYVANCDRIVPHPSYQAYSYSRTIMNYSNAVCDGKINLVPCAYLHNFQDQYRDVLGNEIYKEWYNEAPFFTKSQTSDFSEFVRKHISRRSSNGDILYLIDEGRLHPTKALQDSLVSMVKGNPEFVLLDEQAVCFDMCLRTMIQCNKDHKKRTIIVQGGPGTGKSVLAINLLMEFIRNGLNSSYVTKNSAPRKAFLSLLTNSDARKAVDIKSLFRSPFGMCAVKENMYDCLIVDEAHRLVERMYGDFNGKNQVKECISASMLSIFLLDENQAVTSKDIGSIDEIRKWCGVLGSRLVMRDETHLTSQFRCNGSDAYIHFIDRILQIDDTTDNVSLSELNYDFRVFDDPCMMRECLRERNQVNNKSRMVAGYCFDWNVKNHREGYDFDIYLPCGFQAKWNLEGDDIWAINPKSFDEVGCIHTAQGLEFDYVGVIIGNDLSFDVSSGKVITNRTAISRDDHTSGIRGASEEIAARLIRNTYKTLLTRGQKGCYIYCVDEGLRQYIKGVSSKSIR